LTQRQPQQGSGRTAALALSAALHCAALVALVWCAGFDRKAAPPPRRAVTLIALEGLRQTPAAPSAATPARVKPAAARDKAEARPRKPAQPSPASAPLAPPPADPAAALAVAPAPAAAAPAAAPTPDAVAPPAGAANVVAGAEPVEPLPLLYLAEVSRMIRAHLAPGGRPDHARGTVVVHIILARDGTVLGAAVVQGAGYAALDEAAREVVLRIHKFPELPGEFARGQQQFAIDQPIGFNS
jgi:TonB family protein